MQPSGRSFCMLAAEWSSVAMRKLAAVCERAIGRTEQQGGEQPLKKVLLFVALNVPKVAGTWVAPEHLLQNYQSTNAAFDLVGFS